MRKQHDSQLIECPDCGGYMKTKFAFITPCISCNSTKLIDAGKPLVSKEENYERKGEILAGLPANEIGFAFGLSKTKEADVKRG